MNRQERTDWLNQCVEDAVFELEEQIAQGHTEGFLEILEFYARFHKYSLANCILIAMQNRNASQVAGYKSWEKMGYHVEEGQKAIWIRGPLLRKMTDPDTGEIVERLTGYIALPVFDVSQLQGDVVLPSPRHALEGDFETLYTVARVKIGAQGILCDEEPLPTGVHGMSTGGRIIINPRISTSEKFVCLLHEVVHEVMHKGDDRDGTSKNQRELEAEAGSYLLAKLYGLTNPFSADYILHYSGTVTDFHESLIRIHAAVKKVADWLYIEPPQRQAEAA